MNPDTSKARKSATLQIRLEGSIRREISETARALGQTDTAYLVAAHKLFKAELARRGVLPNQDIIDTNCPDTWKYTPWRTKTCVSVRFEPLFFIRAK